MALAAGSKLGPYEIVALIGAGGMGEVYRAHDPKLKRDVALKVLPDAFANDPDRLARFTREAQVLASLNHPNIAQIYGVEDRALVMELVEGESPKGPLEFEEGWKICSQIADGLEYAHDKGIVHRDLKPANIKVTPEGVVKLLDFGLAKAFRPEVAAPADGDNSPTLTLGATQMGVILGTAAYMAPEQAKGRSVDKRADIWSFGVVLYELLTGERLFKGDDVSETLAHVLTLKPEFEKAPVQARRLLRRCLEKDPKKRMRDIAEARHFLDSASSEAYSQAQDVSQPEKGKWAWAGWVTAAVMAAAAIVALWAPWRGALRAPELTRFDVPAPEKTDFTNPLALSPDGRQLAFMTTGEGGTQIWVRSLDTLQARRVATVSNNTAPFWSPDSRFIAFQMDGKLKKVDITGGPPTTLSDAPQGFGGGAWNTEGVIVFGNRNGPLMQVSSAGGIPAPLTKLDEKRQEFAHSFPSFLPDGKHFVYIRRSGNPEQTGIYIGSLNAAPDKQDSKLLIATENAALYTPVPDPREATRGLGFLLFLREGTLMAQPFDAAKLALKGEPVPIAEQVGATTYAYGRFSASPTGGLAYWAGGGGGGGATRLTWFDRSGKNLGTIGQPGSYNTLALSPDGSRVAAEKADGAASDLWLIESTPGGKSDRFTFDPAQDSAPVWSPDGSQIIFSSNRAGGAMNLFKKPSNLAGNEVELFKSAERKFATDWSRDGKTLVLSVLGNNPDLWSLALEPSKDAGAGAKDAGPRAEVFLKTDKQEYRGKLSPDGRWMAYTSNATGRAEVYVRPFPVSPDRTGQQMVSNGGGSDPLWRRDGRELFYRAAQGVMAVDVTPAAVFKSGQPKQLFPMTQFANINGSAGYNWDVKADGSRFLINTTGGENAAQAPTTWVLNWTAGLK